MTNGSAKRQLPNWLDAWTDYTSVLSSPEIFRRWAGIGMLAAAMERKIYVRTKGSLLYPNLYIVLVGPPGTGKSAVLAPAERTLRDVTELFIAPSSLTTASLIDTLALAQRKIIRPTFTPNFVQFNSLQVFASELGVFLPIYDASFMNTLTKLYDGETYEERRRTGKVNHIRIDNPQLSIIGGTTPSYLNGFLPDGAWDQGFTSRTILVFSGEQPSTPIFGEEDEFARLESEYKGLLHDLKAIAADYGKMEFDNDAATAIVAWNHAGLPPVPEHGKLTYYNSRRLAHCLKLCMVASISRSSDLRIRVDDYQTALDWLLEAEGVMPDIFKQMGVSGDARVIEDLWYFVYKIHSKNQAPIAEHTIYQFLMDRTPNYNVKSIVETMVRGKLLIHEINHGLSFYKPGSKQQR